LGFFFRRRRRLPHLGFRQETKATGGEKKNTFGGIKKWLRELSLVDVLTSPVSQSASRQVPLYCELLASKASSSCRFHFLFLCFGSRLRELFPVSDRRRVPFFPLMLLRGQSTAHLAFFFFSLPQKEGEREKKIARLEPGAFSEMDGALACRTRTAAAPRKRERKRPPRFSSPPRTEKTRLILRRKKEAPGRIARAPFFSFSSRRIFLVVMDPH
jgi:hypothetical protein